MSCHHNKNSFTISGQHKEYNLLALDDCVFCTLISFPENDEDIAEMMWEQVCLNNSLLVEDKQKLLPLLVEFYHSNKNIFFSPQQNCEGCTICQ